MYSCLVHGWTSHQNMCPVCSSLMIHYTSSSALEIPAKKEITDKKNHYALYRGADGKSFGPFEAILFGIFKCSEFLEDVYLLNIGDEVALVDVNGSVLNKRLIIESVTSNEKDEGFTVLVKELVDSRWYIDYPILFQSSW